MEISEKLLNIVLEKELEKKYDGSYIFICNGIINLENNEVSSTLGFYDSEIDFFINIYELAHKCKEWAKYNELLGNSGYDLYTKHLKGINYPSAMKDKPLNKNYDYWICFYSRYNHISSTIGQGIRESEAIFKACQWILDNKEG